MLSSYRLRSSTSGLHIFPDIPWKERPKATNSKTENRRSENKKTIIIHGVPELLNHSPDEVEAHDREQWCFIREKLSLSNVIAQSITRIPTSSKYKGCGPKLIKLVLQSELMVPVLLANWVNFRGRLPTEIRLRAAGTQPRVIGDSHKTANSTEPAVVEPRDVADSETLVKLDGVWHTKGDLLHPQCSTRSPDQTATQTSISKQKKTIKSRPLSGRQN